MSINKANTFTADQTIDTTGAVATVSIKSDQGTDTNDVAQVNYVGHDDGSNDTIYARTLSTIIDNTDATEDGLYSIQTMQAGTLTDNFHFGLGAYAEGATGGDQGAGTINVNSIYVDGVDVGPTAVSPAKVWVKFQGSSTIDDSFNVDSITDNGTGDYTINFTTDFANVNYAVAGGGRYIAGTNDAIAVGINETDGQAVGSCRIETLSLGGTGSSQNDPDIVCFVAFGDQ